ncbi:Gypsy retrotransposon integrase-like protein 1, partial [Marasmius crinis-equi]
FDLPLPIECDDEFWETEDPEMAFKQPLGNRYAVRKTDMWTRMGISGPEWTKKIVAELDSVLNASGGHVWMFPTVMIVLYVNTSKGKKTSDVVRDVRRCIRILRRYEIAYGSSLLLAIWANCDSYKSQVTGRF